MLIFCSIVHEYAAVCLSQLACLITTVLILLLAYCPDDHFLIHCLASYCMVDVCAWCNVLLLALVVSVQLLVAYYCHWSASVVIGGWLLPLIISYITITVMASDMLGKQLQHLLSKLRPCILIYYHFLNFLPAQVHQTK